MNDEVNLDKAVRIPMTARCKDTFDPVFYFRDKVTKENIDISASTFTATLTRAGDKSATPIISFSVGAGNLIRPDNYRIKLYLQRLDIPPGKYIIDLQGVDGNGRYETPILALLTANFDNTPN